MLHTLLIALATIGSIAAILVFLMSITRRQKRKKMQHLKAEFHALLEQYQLHPDHSQFFEHRIFGLDSTAGVFVFVQDDEALPQAVIHLAEVQDCKLWKDGVEIKHKNGKQKETSEEYISAIGLSFHRKGGIITNVPVYTEVLDGILEKIPLHNIAEQWQLRIKNELGQVKSAHREMAG
ncbi:MAG: hypothetical protein ABI378_01435 [Chitinophagaceae bacterium]